MGVKDLISPALKVEILLPDKSLWVFDRAKTLSVEGMTTASGMDEKILKLVKAKQLIPKFKPQMYRTFFGIREKLVVYTPDYLNYYPLDTYFEAEKFGIKPEDYNHRFMKGLLKSNLVTRYKREEWWRTYMPLIFITVLIVAAAVYQKAAIAEQRQIAEILRGVRDSAEASGIMRATQEGLAPSPGPTP